MTGHEYSFTEAVKIVNCSQSTLQRKLKSDGIKLGATKLKRGWRIPVETLEALGLLDVTTSHEDPAKTSHDQSETSHEIMALRVENATLRAENEGLKQVLAEREKVVALLEQKPKKHHFWERLWQPPVNE